MTTLPTTPARRLQKPSWRDARLLVGLVLVLLAAALGAKAVASADERTAVWAMAADVARGDAIEAGDLKRVDVRLDDGVATYASAAHPLAQGSFAGRDLRVGELLPQSAVIPATALTAQRVTLPVSATSVRSLLRGSRVDVYVTSSGQNDKLVARKALEGVGVAEVMAAGSAMSGSRTTSVAVLVPQDKVAEILEAVDGKSSITLVPVAGSLTASAQ